MSELIKREDAINAVEMFFKDAYIEDADVHCTDMVYEINHIPAASPWHRVEEPPKEYDTVLAYVDPWHIVSASYSKYRGWKEADGFNVVGVTHWMPIEPPKEEE